MNNGGWMSYPSWGKEENEELRITIVFDADPAMPGDSSLQKWLGSKRAVYVEQCGDGPWLYIRGRR